MTDFTREGLEGAFPRFAGFSMLGKGGEGAVFSVWDRVRKVDLALKLMRDSGDPELGERFEREYRILASSRSPLLVTVFDHGRAKVTLSSGDAPKHYWYTMEMCESNLRKELRGLSLLARVDVTNQLLDALAFLHAKGIAHRDVKPENIFLMRQAQVKLGDFGLAMVSSHTSAGGGQSAVVRGSPPYLAPERWTGREGEDWRPSDQYAAGVMVFEMLSRGGAALPFGSELGSYFRAHVSGEVHALVIPELRGARFSAVDRVLRRMLAKHPAARYPDIAMCKRELAAALAQDGVA